MRGINFKAIIAPVRGLGWILIMSGGLSIVLGLYLSDPLSLLLTAILHFFGHLQMLWASMGSASRALVEGGLLALPLGMGLLLWGSLR